MNLHRVGHVIPLADTGEVRSLDGGRDSGPCMRLATAQFMNLDKYVQDSQAHGDDNAKLLFFAHLQVVDDDEGEPGQYKVEESGVCCDTINLANLEQGTVDLHPAKIA